MVEIVIGAGYGDEGKGMTVDWLTKNSIVTDSVMPTVVRFSGGHQCGHRVVHEDKEHIFSNFGSGTLRSAPTFWGKMCTVDPVGLVKEYKELVSKDVRPLIYMDPECPVVTPFDKRSNQLTERYLDHGSTGVGFGATIDRNEGACKLKVVELRSKKILNHKIEKFFGSISFRVNNDKDFIDYQYLLKEFYESVDEMMDIITIIPDYQFFLDVNDEYFILEGNQGIMLDDEYGFFPHVTRAPTTSRGAQYILDAMKFSEVPVIHYVTRAYATRHGNGPLPGEEFSDFLKLKEMHGEANKDHEWQGKFRTAPIDLDMLRYAIRIDESTRRFPANISVSNLIVTCCDHLPSRDSVMVCINDKLVEKNIHQTFENVHFQMRLMGSPTWSSKASI